RNYAEGNGRYAMSITPGTRPVARAERPGHRLQQGRTVESGSRTMTDFAEGCMSSARDLAGRLHRRWLEENPFSATMYGIPGYDDLVPDDSEEGQQAWRAE